MKKLPFALTLLICIAFVNATPQSTFQGLASRAGEILENFAHHSTPQRRFIADFPTELHESQVLLSNALDSFIEELQTIHDQIAEDASQKRVRKYIDKKIPKLRTTYLHFNTAIMTEHPSPNHILSTAGKFVKAAKSIGEKVWRLDECHQEYYVNAYKEFVDTLDAIQEAVQQAAEGTQHTGGHGGPHDPRYSGSR